MDRPAGAPLWSGTEPAITFVIAAFNAERTLPDTLRSLLAQTRRDWTAVVVNDGSTDGTAAVAGSTGDARIRVVSQANKGLACARNTGLRSAGGAAVCFLDADDCVDPRFVELMAGALGPEGSGADLAACSYRMVGPTLEDLGWTVRVGAHDAAVDRLVEFNAFAVGGVVVRRSAAARLLGAGHPALFDERLRVHEDWDCWLRLSGAGARWAVVDRPLFDYRITPGSMSGDLGRMWTVGLRVIERAPTDPEHRREAARRWTIRHVARAVARGDADLCARLRAELRSGGRDLHETDAGLLAGSLRWALAREAGRSPDRAGPWLDAGRERAAAMLRDVPGLSDILARLSGSGRDWSAAAERLTAAVGPRDVLVLYGMGRNGRDLVAALDRVGYRGRVAWIDDHPSAGPPGRIGGQEPARLRIDHLTARHLVLVTPDARRPIVRRLREHGVSRVVTPDDVPAPAGTA